MRKVVFTVALMSVVFLPACRRTGGDVWQDTKSCGRHMQQGIAALGGKQRHSRMIQDADQFAGPREDEFIPLHDEDIYEKIVVGNIDADTPIPQSRVSPGELGSAIPGVDSFQNPTSQELSAIFQNLHFPTNNYAISGTENQRIVRNIVSYLQKNPNVYLFIEGHCDERGADSYNLALGSRRSNAVRNALIKSGVDLDRLFTVSYGKEKPVARGHTSDDWSQNRRSQFKIYRRS